MVVMPSATLESPLCRRLFIPAATAARFKSSAVAPARTCSRSSSPIGMTS